MKINKIIVTLICGFSFSVSAQMLDLIGSGAIGGAMTKGSVASVNQGMKMLKYTQLTQSLIQNAHMIRIHHMGQYNKVGQVDISEGSLKRYNATAGVADIPNHFFIEIYQVEKDLCKRLVDGSVGAKRVEVNNAGNNIGACSEKSKIKFTFE